MARLLWALLLCGVVNAAVIGNPSRIIVNSPTKTLIHGKRDDAATVTAFPMSQPEQPAKIGNLIQKRAISLPNASGTWMSIPCDATGVVDENPANMTQRYVDAGVPGSYTSFHSVLQVLGTDLLSVSRSMERPYEGMEYLLASSYGSD